MDEQSLTGILSSELATASFGAALAAVLQPGDLVFLTGEMGAGKTALARAIIRSLTGPDTHVPSPTFTLVTPYDEARKPIWHADLYRLNAPEESFELGLVEARDDHIILVEWPERAEGLLGTPNLTLTLSHHGATERAITLMGHEPQQFDLVRAAWARHQARMHFLDTHSVASDRPYLDPITGDASARAYFRLTSDTHTNIVMDWPQGPDGPAIYDGQSYSQKAHLAENVVDFTTMVQWLTAHGFSAPRIDAQDESHGLLLLEDLGATTIADISDPAIRDHFYFEAIALLAALHRLPPAPDRASYDKNVLTFETELFLDWYLPAHDVTVSDEARRHWRQIWHGLCLDVLHLPAVTVLRDYHSPNLLWLAERQSYHRIGLIDVQDALAGSPAYDAVSLLQDARIDIDPALTQRGLQQYCQLAFAEGHETSEPGALDYSAQFTREFWLLGVQRNLKIAGIFHRLARRDGKPAYLKHVPRIETYISAGLEHLPEMDAIRDWARQYAPSIDWLVGHIENSAEKPKV